MKYAGELTRKHHGCDRIDAASNSGVDDIRELRENVQYPPSKGKYKVYIVDEVHMLSTGAFNALLKTLEEPPSFVIFILRPPNHIKFLLRSSLDVSVLILRGKRTPNHPAVAVYLFEMNIAAEEKH